MEIRMTQAELDEALDAFADRPSYAPHFQKATTGYVLTIHLGGYQEHIGVRIVEEEEDAAMRGLEGLPSFRAYDPTIDRNFDDFDRKRDEHFANLPAHERRQP